MGRPLLAYVQVFMCSLPIVPDFTTAALAFFDQAEIKSCSPMATYGYSSALIMAYARRVDNGSSGLLLSARPNSPMTPLKAGF